MNFDKNLIGKHSLVGAGGGNNYYFSLPAAPIGSAIPNAIDNQVIEEVYISVNTTLGAVNIFLPAISTFNLAWNAKIYIVHSAGANALSVYPYATEGPAISDTINGFNVKTLNAVSDAAYLHIVADNIWMYLLCIGPRA
jgi:hypothetical protein